VRWFLGLVVGKEGTWIRFYFDRNSPR